MTQPQHCEHEGWCWHQILGCKPLEDGKPKCAREGCEGDTRTHTLASQAERLCDDGCDIFELEERVMELEQELKDARKDERERVLDALEQKILSKILPKSQQWEPGMYIQYDDVLSMIESLRGGGAP